MRRAGGKLLPNELKSIVGGITNLMNARIVLATANPHKAEEINALLEALDIAVQVVSLLDFPQVIIPEEDGETLEENAILKAEAVANQTGLVALADDSGLEVEALGGAPGVHSKRFAGENATDPERYGKLLALMKEVPEGKRQAQFRCCIAIAIPNRKTEVVEGICPGKIAFAPAGEYGFGYDPVFIPEGMNITMAQLPMDEKNKISHRSRALEAAVPVVRRILKEITD
jgi:XTP/dITP diphosphohydrolase